MLNLLAIKRVTVLSPHPDDETFGPGALIAWLATQGAYVNVLHITDGELDTGRIAARRSEAENAARILGVTNVQFAGCMPRAIRARGDMVPLVARILRSDSPDLLLLPHREEMDRDHRDVWELGTEATYLSSGRDLPGKPCARISIVLGYEVWSPICQPALVVPFGRQAAEQKRKAALAYRSQMAMRSYRRAIAGLNLYRGGMWSEAQMAEAYTVETLREVSE